MSQNEEPKERLQDTSRREALAKLAKMTAYSTPAVVTLLTPQLSHAQSSIAPGNPNCFGGGWHTANGADSNPGSDNFDANSGGFFGLLFGDNGFFNSSGNDTGTDCGS